VLLYTSSHSLALLSRTRFVRMENTRDFIGTRHLGSVCTEDKDCMYNQNTDPEGYCGADNKCYLKCPDTTNWGTNCVNRRGQVFDNPIVNFGESSHYNRPVRPIFQQKCFYGTKLKDGKCMGLDAKNPECGISYDPELINEYNRRETENWEEQCRVSGVNRFGVRVGDRMHPGRGASIAELPPRRQRGTYIPDDPTDYQSISRNVVPTKFEMQKRRAAAEAMAGFNQPSFASRAKYTFTSWCRTSIFAWILLFVLLCAILGVVAYGVTKRG